MSTETWRQRAACRGLDPGLFHPERGEPTKAVKALCMTCPVQDDCLRYAIENDERVGIWGGKSERERRAIRRRQRTAARANVATVAAAITWRDVDSQAARRETAVRLHRQGVPVADIARILGCQDTTIWRYIRRAA